MGHIIKNATQAAANLPTANESSSRQTGSLADSAKNVSDIITRTSREIGSNGQGGDSGDKMAEKNDIKAAWQGISQSSNPPSWSDFVGEIKSDIGTNAHSWDNVLPDEMPSDENISR